MDDTNRELGTLMPSVRIPPPGPVSRELAGRLGAHETPNASEVSVGVIPIFWEQTRGANIVDVDGNLYVDLTAGFCVAVAGHSHPRIVAAIAEQAAIMMHAQGAANPSRRRVEIIERLAELAPPGLTDVHVGNTGAEAVEMALKTARLSTGKPTVVAFEGGFHGKTIGALAATSQNYYREPFLGELAGTVHLPYAYCYRCPFGLQYPSCETACGKYFEHVLSSPDSGVTGVAAVILEPVQGHGGWIVPPREFLQTVSRVCRERGILLIADEVITGFGRTGKRFATEHFDIVPDIVAVGKGLASGFPISAMLTRPEIGKAWKPLQHTSTFMGNPLGSAAALASLDVIENEGLVQRAATLGTRLKDALVAMQPRHPLMGDIRGLGMMVGIELVKDRETRSPAQKEGKQVIREMLARGIMATNYGGTHHNVIKMSPPLVITTEQLDLAVKVIDESFAVIEGAL